MTQAIAQREHSRKIEVPNEGGYLTFMFVEAEHGLDMLIVGWQSIMLLPAEPEYIKGIINLQGQDVMVIDLEAKNGETPIEMSEQTCIAIFERPFEIGESTLTGVVVEDISGIMRMAADSLEENSNGLQY